MADPNGWPETRRILRSERKVSLFKALVLVSSSTPSAAHDTRFILKAWDEKKSLLELPVPFPHRRVLCPPSHLCLRAQFGVVAAGCRVATS